MTVTHNGKICVDNEQLEGNFTGGLMTNEKLIIGKTGVLPLFGLLTDFNVWNRSLDSNEAQAYSSNCNPSFDRNDMLIDWSQAQIEEK